MSTQIGRREFLGKGVRTAAGSAVLLGGAFSGLLVACGADDEPSSTQPGATKKQLGSLTYQLSWLKNVQFAGTWYADSKGYFKNEGFNSLTFLPGGADVDPGPIVVSKRAGVGISSAQRLGPAVLEGAPVKIIGSKYQTNGQGVVSLAENPVRDPKDLEGKTIGVLAASESIWNAFVELTNLDISKVTKVPYQFSIDPLINGEVDALFALYSSQPVAVKLAGKEPVWLAMKDYGFDTLSYTHFATDDAIQDNREALVAFMRAEIRGWQDNQDDPEGGARLAVEQYGKDLGLDLQQQVQENQNQIDMMLSDSTKEHGLLWLGDPEIDITIDSLAKVGFKLTPDQLFNTEILKEAYGGKNRL